MQILPRKITRRRKKSRRRQPLTVDRLLARAIALAHHDQDYSREIRLARVLAALEEAAERAERRVGA